MNLPIELGIFLPAERIAEDVKVVVGIMERSRNVVPMRSEMKPYSLSLVYLVS